MKINLGSKSALWMSALLCGLLTFGALNAFPQAETGQIVGSVSDPSGASVPGAKVTVKSVATGTERSQTTSDVGAFTFPNLLPETYEVTVEAPGFTTVKQQTTVTVGMKIGLDLKLEVGKAETVVEVQATGVVAVNTETQTITQVLSTQQILELPTITRNPYSLIVTSGNVSEDDPTGGGGTGRGAGVTINGLRSSGTNVMLDGVANNAEFTAQVGQTVPLDSVQEIGIITNNFTAEYGRADAGIINVTTKSGTNEFHGTAYEFNRVSDLAANTFNNNAYGLDKPVFVRNQFGYSLGGPAKKNKLFFFSSTEWTRVRSAANITTIVPDPALIAASAPATQAVFSAYGKLAPGASIVQTLSRNQLIAQGSDPCTGSSPTGGCLNYNPTAPMFDLVGYNVPSNSGAGNPQNAWSNVNRVDYNLSDKTTIYTRYAVQSEVDQAGGISNSPYAGDNIGQTSFNNSLIVSMTHTFSPRFVSQSKLDFNRFNTAQPLPENGLVPSYYLGSATGGTSLGSHSVYLPGDEPSSAGNGGYPYGGPQNFGEAYQDFSYTVGKHELRFGGSIEYLRDNRSYGAYNQSNQIFGNSVGSGVDNFLAGQLYSYVAAIDPQGKFPCVNGVQTPACTVNLPVGPPDFERSNRYHEGAVYFQDSWKFSRRLTFNLGIRWEYFGVQHNVNANLDSNFYPAGGAYYGPGEFVGMENGQVDTVPNSPIKELWQPSKTNFAPRVGFAWDVFGDGKTALRGGYGIGFERNFGNVTYNVLFNPPNFEVVDLITGSNIPSIAVSPSNAGPLAGSNGSIALPPAELRYIQPNIPQAFAHLISASLEHQFGDGMHLEVDYSASIGENLYDISYMNAPGQGNYYLGIPCNPSETLAGGPDACTAVINNQYGLINRRGAGGYSTYNALNVRYDINNIKNSGLTLRMNYTWSHSLDDLSDSFSSSQNQFNLGYTDLVHPMVDYGNSEFDNRHRIALSLIYAPPFAHGLKGPAKYLLDGWEFAPVFTARTGAPYTVYDLTNQSPSGYIYSRVLANQVIPANGNEYVNEGANNFGILDFSQIAVTHYLNPIIGNSDFGPFPANMTGRDYFHTPGAYNLDFGAYKSIRFTERMSLQLRLEAFNVFNHSNEYVNIGSAYIAGNSGDITASYGVIPNTATTGPQLYENRNIQLAAKFIF
ncbi:MAG: TonB-dependent receptor domain-containing protein [Bryobacteraceae bacterium]